MRMEPRNTQKNGFMEKLLDGVEVEWKALGDVIKTVTAPSKLKRAAYRATGEIPIIDQGIEFIAGYTDKKSHRVSMLLLATILSILNMLTSNLFKVLMA